MNATQDDLLPEDESGDLGEEVAVVGMSGRFPGAASVAELWRNLAAGVDSISFFSDEELLASGVPRAVFSQERYVRARGVLADPELFDAGCFGFSPREAAITDPQHRLFLECALEALEEAGLDPDTFAGRVGVYAGSTLSTYLLFHLLPRLAPEEEGSWQAVLSNDKDTLATRVSYKLNLRGPSLSVQTACSTSLVAVHLARQALLDYECDVALAGGVAVRSPQKVGYLYQEGGILSPDGHCRAFDASARGAVFGSGAGVVVLKRLADALADGDTVRAVLKGSAINNDGAGKVGFTAPSADGQSEVVSRALALAGVPAETVQYVETHGSATPLGDPIEIAGLTRAFRGAGATGRGFCAVGSIKTNVGHLDSAAGVSGLIKTVLSLEQGQIPPSLHFERPNPHIDFASTPFFVNDRLRVWERGETPRRAGVNSFGIGGTNAHVVVEEAPPLPATSPSRPWQLLVLSAKTETALASAASRLAAHLGHEGAPDLPDAAFTLAVGRRGLPFRHAVLARDREEAIAGLEGRGRAERSIGGRRREGTPSVAFYFPGQGGQQVGIGRELYDAEPLFRREVDRSAEILRPLLGEDIRRILFPAAGREEEAARVLGRTAVSQASLVAVEAALARLWLSWGVRPEVMLGHSLGEYVAAHVAGVMTLEEVLGLVVARGELVERVPGGSMLVVPLAEEDLLPLLGAELSIASVNGPLQCVVAGPSPAVAELEAELARRGAAGQYLPVPHAFHTRQMEPLVGPFVERVRRVRLAPPQIPFFSSVSGRVANAEEVTDPAYWGEHLCRTVRLSEGMSALLSDPDRVLVEVVPGGGQTRLLRGGAGGGTSELAALLTTLGRLWVAGVAIDWPAYYAGERRRRVPLPTYPFERQRHWIELGRIERPAGEPAAAEGAGASEDVAALPADPVGRIAAIWRQILGVGEIGPEDRFFDLGGDSLIALQVVARLRDAFGVELPVATLFAHPTLAGLAAAVEAAGGHLGASPAAAGEEAETGGPIRPRSRELDGEAELLPLSWPQERFWFLDQLEPGNPAFTITETARLTGTLDVGAFVRAFHRVAMRHESLRTRFVPIEGAPRQQVEAAVRIPLPVFDLTALPAGARAAEAARLATEEAQRPFDLGRLPLLRAPLLRLAGDEHRLLLAVHHIIADGWSLNVLLRETAALYRLEVEGKAGEELPPPAIQYGDYALWQRRRLTGEVVESHLEYWRGKLAGASRLSLPTDRPRPAVPGAAAGACGIELSGEAWGRVVGFAERTGATPFTVLLAGLGAVLGRHASATDVTVGTPSANRDRPETQGVIGLFLNTLALRTELADDPTFSELLQRVRMTVLEAFAHQELPFEQVLEAVQPERSLNRTPLFDVLLNFLLFGGDRLELPSLTLEAVPVVDHAAKLDLTLYALPLGERLRLTAVYRSELFDGSTIERLLGHLAHFLGAAVERPEATLTTLPLLGEAERRELLRAENRLGPEIPYEPFPASALQGSLPARFAEQAARRPDAVAIAWGGHAWTYGELDRRSDRLAEAVLALCGVGEGRVGLLFEPGGPLLAALLGTLKAGKTYVPLDRSYPRERLAFLLEDSASTLLVTQDSSLSLARDLARGLLPILDADRAGAPGPVNGGAPALDVPPETAAYILYTSGSTGRPKGVVQTHGNVLAHVRNHSNLMHVSSSDRLSWLPSLSHDAAVVDLYGGLLNGATLFAFDVREQGTAAIPSWLEEREITVYHSTPTVFRHVAGALDGRKASSSLRLVVLGGETATRQDFELFKQSLRPGSLLANGLGPSESTVALHFFADHATPVRGATVPVGYPVEGTRIELQNERGEAVEVLAIGEVVIHSRHVALGYWRRLDLTAAAFSGEPGGERSYRTGDLGRQLLDGSIEFVGRRDFQVKIRGHRVELGEIEATLARCPGVREAVVVARGGDGGDLMVVGYAVPRTGESLSVGDLAAFARRSLPEPMVPAAFVILDELPLTPTRKVDRAALPAPELSQVVAEESYAPPRTPVEEVLSGIWCEVLRLERVGVEQSFFELGGHSLLATQVVARARAAFGVELPLRRLFETPTVAGLAAAVEAARRAGRPGEAPPLRPASRQEPLPLAYAQDRLWFLDQLEQGAGLYSLPFAMRFRGTLYPAVLAASIAEIARRHEVLRTRFVAVGGRPVQVIDAAWRPPLPQVDLAGLPAARSAAELERLMTSEQGPPFDLARGPLLHTTLVRQAEGDFVLLVTLHHIITDGWSMGVLRRELAAIYPAFAEGRPHSLPALPVQYADFAAWQRGWLRDEALAAQLGYWERQLAGLPHLELPTDRSPVAGQIFRAGVHPLAVAEPLVERLHALARRRGATPFMVLLAVFQALLHRHSGQDDIAVGTPIANRNRVELEPLIGFFVNNLVLRTRCDGSPSFAGLLERVREVTLEAYDHQDLPFTLLLETLQPDRREGSIPLVDAMFALQNQPVPSIELPGVELSSLPVPAGAEALTQFALVLVAWEWQGKLVGTLSYNAALLDRTTVARWREHWSNLLLAALEDLERPVGELPLLGEGERHQILYEWGHEAEVVIEGDGPAPIGIWGEEHRSAEDGTLTRTGRRVRRRADGSLEEARSAAPPDDPTAAAMPDADPQDRQRVAEARSELSRRRDGLSEAQRELLAKRLGRPRTTPGDSGRDGTAP